MFFFSKKISSTGYTAFRRRFVLMATSSFKRMSRVSPTNPVRRRLFADDSDEARVDNCANVLQESIAAEREQKMQKWNFDFVNEVPLEGVYEWYRPESPSSNDWIGVKTDTKIDDTDNIDITQDSFLPMKTENEITPKTKEEELAPLLRKRRKDVENSNEKARRRIRFD